MNGELRIDLHVHSRHSPDSGMPVEAIAARVVEGGLRGFALTDHNSVRGLRELSELQRRYPRYLFVPGVEVSTHEGHLLAYGLSEAPPTDRSVAETIEWVEARAGVCVLPHPFRRTHGAGERIARSAAVPAIEGRNGHNSEITNARAELVAAQRQLGTTGGSDAHRLAEIGRTYTVFPEPTSTLDELLEHLRHRDCRGEGRSLSGWGRAAISLRSGLLRVGRGFRPI